MILSDGGLVVLAVEHSFALLREVKPQDARNEALLTDVAGSAERIAAWEAISQVETA